MKYNRLSFLSVFVALGLMPSVSGAAIRVGNLSRSNAQGYQQVNEQRYQQTTASVAVEPTVQDSPISGTDARLASQILPGDVSAPMTLNQLETCKLIYPNGTFEWARPTIGMMAGAEPTCTSVVELRVIGQGLNGGDLVVARANLAAGDSFECNIYNFPEMSWTDDAGNVTFPANKEPTVEDVKKVMDEEQKQNAAVKIVGGIVLGSLLGNMIGDNEPGKDGLLGGGRDKITTTVAGALGGGGLMAASTYSGKVAGDMILSTGINAAAGAVVGNMAASGDSVLRIEKCVVDDTENTCLWGYLEQTNNLKEGETGYISVTNIYDFKVCDATECKSANLTGRQVEGYENIKNVKNNELYTLKEMYSEQFGHAENKYCFEEKKMKDFGNCHKEDAPVYVELKDAKYVAKRVPAMLVGIEEPAFGYKTADWEENKKDYSNNRIVGRAGNGDVTTLASGIDAKLDMFKPMEREASDGGMIDLSNKARLKGTLTGAGVGGAAGAYTAYQGAQSEIDERWVSAVREYKDSLQKFYCGTGTRFLSFYNDITVIPKQNQ